MIETTDGVAPTDVTRPTIEELVELQEQLTPHQWESRMARAKRAVWIVHEVRKLHKERGKEVSWRACLRKVEPLVSWSCYLHWRRRLAVEKGQEWERLFDRRLPPRPTPIPPDVLDAGTILKRADVTISVESVQANLRVQFGDRGKVSGSALRKVWRAAGLKQGPKGDATRFEVVEHFHGGGGLALLLAANLATGAYLNLAKAALAFGSKVAAEQAPNTPETTAPGRNELGQFTADFNHAIREGVDDGQTDRRWDTDERKRQQCDLSSLQLLKLSPGIVARRFFAIGLIPLLSDRRGFDGLDGPKGEYLGVTGMHAYKDSTLDKTLTQAALLGVGPALWQCHARFAAKLAMEWSNTGANSWPSRIILYVDGTAEPYWTGQFAKSGKISRCGRIGPCMSRVALMGGPGVPLIIKSASGSQSLKKMLPGLLEEADQALGPGLVGRTTIVDAEVASAAFLHELMGIKNHIFVTVLKGPGFRSPDIKEPGEWTDYGDRDRIRSGILTIHGKDAPEEGVTLNVIQRERTGGRNPQTTLFATNASFDDLSPKNLVTLYLSRWPNQEQRFRDTRNGLGFEHTHGFGGEYVSHVAVETAMDKATARVERTERQVGDCEAAVSLLKTRVKESKGELKQANNSLLKHALKEEKAAKAAHGDATKEMNKLKTMPKEIYSRDATRENLVTALTVTVMVLIDYVLRNFFGGLKMEYRTFIEHFMHTPTIVRTSHCRVLYQFEANARNCRMTDELKAACLVITQLRLRSEGRLLVFEVLEPSGQ